MLTEEVPRPRTITGDLVVQIHMDDGMYHRQAIGGRATACGVEVNHSNRHAHRLETYDHLLCSKCFTEFELGLGLAKKEG